MKDEKKKDYINLVEDSASALRQRELKKQCKVSGVLLTVIFQDGTSVDTTMCEPGFGLQLLGATEMTKLGLMTQISLQMQDK